MKNLLFVLFCITFFYSFGQNPNLFEKRWFVENISINGTDVSIPADYFDFPFTYLDFYNSGSGLVGSSNNEMKTDCYSGFTAHITFIDNGNSLSSFQFTDFTPFQTNTGCQTQQDANMLSFMDTYKSFFQNGIDEEFTYFILDVYGIDHLKVEKTNGDYIWFTELPNPILNNELIDNTWHLSKMIIDGENLYVPDLSNEEFDVISLDILSYYFENVDEHVLDIQQTFQTSACNLSIGMINLYTNTNEFYLYNIGGTLSDCGNVIVSSYSNQYMNFYINNLPGPFSYEIINNDELIVTNPVGNQTYYNRNTLSVQNETIARFEVYPNPTSTILYIQQFNNTIKNVKLFTVLGQELLSTNQLSLDISKLEKGYYLIEVTFNTNKKLYKKIIKK